MARDSLPMMNPSFKSFLMMSDSIPSSISSSSTKTSPPAHTQKLNKQKKKKHSLNIEHIQTKSTPFRIATLNVRGLNDKAKQTLLIDQIRTHDIQIAGISE